MKRDEFIKGVSVSAGMSLMGNVMQPSERMVEYITKTKSLNLKIDNIKTFIVNHEGSDENFVFVKVYTNKGLTGLGEATLPSKALTVEQAILEHKRFLVGKDPGNIEWLWQGMFRGPRYRGGPILMGAISAIEIALWDIIGKALKQPIWKLLGGKARQRIRFYPHFNHSLNPKNPYDKIVDEEPLTPAIYTDSQKYAAYWLRRKKEGWTACKGPFLKFFDQTMRPTVRNTSIRQGIANLQAVREVVGEDFDILVELHGKATPPMVRDFCRQAETFHPMFIEEPGQIEDMGEWGLLRSHTSTPIATGERLFTEYGRIKYLCQHHLVDYIQPDVIHAGGILELKKIGAIAAANRIEMCPHNPQSLVCTMASMHINMCTPNAIILELGSGSFWNEDLFHGAAITFKNGYASPPQKPGLGIDLNEKVAAKMPYVPKDWHNPQFHDGSWSDR